MSVQMVPTTINGRWTLLLPEHRAVRPEWVTGWETERIAAMHDCISALRKAMNPEFAEIVQFTGSAAQAIRNAEIVSNQRRPVVVDVGAEEGDMTALWASWGCDVFLVEPNPRVWPNIRVIFEANELTDRVRGWWVGFASEGEQEVTIHDEDDLRETSPFGPWPNCAYGGVIGNHGFRHLAEEADITPCRPLDDMVGRVDVITMDVEGAELHVLWGASRILKMDRPEVFVSVHPPALKDFFGETPDDVHRFMVEAGYVPKFLADDHEEHWQYTPEERA